MTKIGFILECGGQDPKRAGPDEQICRYLLGQLRPDITPVFRGLAGKPNVVKDCGTVAKLLLETEHCTCVFIIWDLYPAWREETTPCRKEDCEAIQQSINSAGIRDNQVKLVCIQEELESWLLADHNAVKLILERRKHPHQLTNRVKRWSRPDTVSQPKALLTRLFSKELGSANRYTDYRDAITIIRQAKLDNLLTSCSYSRFKTLLESI